MTTDFSGRTLLLTGAGGGIGRAIAAHFLLAGADVLLADIHLEAAETAAHELGSEGGRAVPMGYDAARADDAAAAVALCLERFGRLDFVVPAAALYEELPFFTMSDDAWRRTMAVNLDGIFYLCRRAVPAMAEGGSIVMIASQSAHAGASARHAPYGASKGGVLTLARSMARELAPSIRVNAVSPGIVDTPMAHELIRTHGTGVLEGVPMGRMGEPREIASAVAFLCSDQASFITGQAIHVNGGAFMGG